MQLIRQIWLLVLACLLSGCAHSLAKRDAICDQVALFANSSTDKQVHSVELITDWGSQFSDYKKSLYTQTCNHQEYAPGEKLCEYLMRNTSIEFAEYNLDRVQACLWPGTRGGPAATDYENLVMKAWSWEARGVDENVRVGVSFNSGQGKAAPSMRIMVERHDGL